MKNLRDFFSDNQLVSLIEISRRYEYEASLALEEWCKKENIPKYLLTALLDGLEEYLSRISDHADDEISLNHLISVAIEVETRYLGSFQGQKGQIFSFTLPKREEYGHYIFLDQLFLGDFNGNLFLLWNNITQEYMFGSIESREFFGQKALPAVEKTELDPKLIESYIMEQGVSLFIRTKEFRPLYYCSKKKLL
ncbi:MAG: hypothetical protein PHU61_03650 [Candidatus Absconditabacteria bacterium]|nr:hypothetical protein [Candidatus Absconditabacteria bacterium]MDD3868371.1 hypothetical protein [Candidatus Absconditabacteria bacterium]MDD4714452.1 hypothetical protein [Candidatus Absconditabacteria bacterium]